MKQLWKNINWWTVFSLLLLLRLCVAYIIPGEEMNNESALAVAIGSVVFAIFALTTQLSTLLVQLEERHRKNHLSEEYLDAMKRNTTKNPRHN